MTISFCMDCDSAFEQTPHEHLAEEHDGSTEVDVRRVVRKKEDGEYITEPDEDMGHYGPHRWTNVGEQVMCVECGAILGNAEPKEYP